jgi:hypothetical protein
MSNSSIMAAAMLNFGFAALLLSMIAIGLRSTPLSDEQKAWILFANQPHEVKTIVLNWADKRGFLILEDINQARRTVGLPDDPYFVSSQSPSK